MSENDRLRRGRLPIEGCRPYAEIGGTAVETGTQLVGIAPLRRVRLGRRRRGQGCRYRRESQRQQENARQYAAKPRAGLRMKQRGGGYHAGILRVRDRSFLQNLLSGGIPAGAFASRVRDRARETGYSRRNGLSRPPPLKILKAPSSATFRNPASTSRDRRSGASGTRACRDRLQSQIMIEKYRRVNSPGGSGKRTDLDRRPEERGRDRAPDENHGRRRFPAKPPRRKNPTAEAGRSDIESGGRTGVLTPRRRAALSSRSFSRRGRSSDRPFPPGRLPSP